MSGAMKAAERAVVQWWALKQPDAHAKYLDAEHGWTELDAHGMTIQESTDG